MKIIKDNILFIEDDKVDRMAFERFAQEEGLPFNYSMAGSVKEADKILHEQKFDAVVSDYMLGDGTAFDMLKKINSIPIIIITGAGDQEIAVKAMKEGAYDYLIKDSKGNYFQTLPATVKKAIRYKRAEEELQGYRERLEELVDLRTAELQKEIADRKQVEELLRYSANIAEALLNVTTESIMLIDRHGIIYAINETGAERLGKAKEELIGECIFSYFPPDIAASRKKRIEGVIKTKNPVRFSDEREGFTFDNNLYPIYDKNNKVINIAFFARDISPLVKLQNDIISTSEKERQIIGQDLHDDLGQYLTGIKYMVTNIKQQLSDNEKIDVSNLEDISLHLGDAIGRVRRMAKGLYPLAIEKNGLLLALEELCHDVEKIYKVSCKIKKSGNIIFDNNTTALHLFYIAQESISNALKHSKANKILLTLVEKNSRLSMIIDNNVISKERSKRGTTGIGIEIMKYRANLIDAKLEFRNDGEHFSVALEFSV